MFDRVATTAATWLRAHVKTLLAVAAGVILPFRLLGVAGWNTDTALAVLQESGTGTLVVGTAVTVVTLAMDMALLVIALLVTYLPMSPHARRWLWVSGIPVALLLAFVPDGALTYLSVVGIWILAPLVRIVLKPDDEAHVLRMLEIGALASVLAFGALAVLFGTFFGDQPWVPLETVRLADGHVEVGYVLNSGDDVTILIGKDHHVEHFAGRPKARAICRSGHTPARRSVANAIGIVRSTPYPVCRDGLV